MTTSKSGSSSGSNRRTSSSRRGVAKSGAGHTQAKKRRKRKKSAESAPDEEIEEEPPPPPRKKRAYRRRARVLNVDENVDINGHGDASTSISTTTTAGVGPGRHDNDMMQLTEQFAQQHYRDMLSHTRAAPTLPLLTQQQLASYAPTSLSWMGIPILMGPGSSEATQSITPQAQPFSVPSLQIPHPPPLTRLLASTCTSITSPSPSMTSQSQPTSTVSRFSGVQIPPGLQLPPAFPLAMPLPLMPQSLQGLSFPTAPTVRRSSRSHITSPHSLTAVSQYPTRASVAQSRQRNTSAPSNLSSTASSSTPMSTASSPSPCTTPSSTVPTASSTAPMTSSTAPMATFTAPMASSTAPTPSSTAPTASSSHIHVTSLTTMTLTSHSSPTQTSPTALTVSSPTVTTNSAQVSQSQDSVHGQVSRGQTPPISTRSQASADEVAFPKGPNFITFVKRPEPVAFLTRQRRTVPSSSSLSSSSTSRRASTNTVSSYVQPHASLLAPEFRQSNHSRHGTATINSPVHSCTSSTSHTSVTSSVSSSQGTPGNSTPYYSFGTSAARNSVVVPSTSHISVTVSVSSPPRTLGNCPFVATLVTQLIF